MILGKAIKRFREESREDATQAEKDQSLYDYLLVSNWEDASKEDISAMVDELARLDKIVN